MKILMLGWELPPHHSGGLGVACYQLCKALSYDGFSIDFVLPYHDTHENINFMNLVPATNLSAEESRYLGGIYDSQNFVSSNSRIEELPSDLRGLQAYYTRAMKNIIAVSAPAAHSARVVRLSIVRRQHDLQVSRLEADLLRRRG